MFGIMTCLMPSLSNTQTNLEFKKRLENCMSSAREIHTAWKKCRRVTSHIRNEMIEAIQSLQDTLDTCLSVGVSRRASVVLIAQALIPVLQASLKVTDTIFTTIFAGFLLAYSVFNNMSVFLKHEQQYRTTWPR